MIHCNILLSKWYNIAIICEEQYELCLRKNENVDPIQLYKIIKKKIVLRN